MALDISVDYSINKAATILRVKDVTGVYNASTNVGGWGTPNQELNESAIFALALRKDSAGNQYLTSSNPVVFDPAAANTKETAFEFTNLNDGVHKFIIGRLPVSDDGIEYINSGGTILEDDYFYYNEKVWKMGATEAEEVELSDLVDESSVAQGSCEDIVIAKLAIQKQTLYKEYRIKRETNCDDAESLFREILKLSEEIKGATYAFYSNLKVEAQDQIETQLDKYQLA